MCTRSFNNVDGKFLTTGRNMDWAAKMDTEMYFFPAGLRKVGVAKDELEANGPKAATWESIYGSVVAMVGGEAASDGMNTEGLVANVLYQSEIKFPKMPDVKNREAVSMLRWVQFVLDNYATVEEVVEAFRSKKLVITNGIVPDENGTKDALLHLSVSDKHGDSAIIEVLDLKDKNIDHGIQKDEFFLISHSKEYRTMTNDPIYPTQLSLNAYWKWQWNDDRNHFATHTLPGSALSPDRFSRADFYVNHLKKATSEQDAVAQVFSVLGAASVPLGYELGPDSPNISQTLWAAVGQQNSLTYYFKDMLYPSAFWTDISSKGIKEIGADLSKESTASACFYLPNKTTEDEVIYYSGQINGDYQLTSDPFAS